MDPETVGRCVGHAVIAFAGKAEFPLMNVEVMKLVGRVDQLPNFPAMQRRACVETGREVIAFVRA